MTSRYLNSERIFFEWIDRTPLRIRMLKAVNTELLLYDHVWTLLIALEVWINEWREQGWIPSAVITILDQIGTPNPRVLIRGIFNLHNREAGCTLGNLNSISARPESE